MKSDLEDLRSLVTLGTALGKIEAAAKKSKRAVHGTGFYASKFQSAQNQIERLAQRIPDMLGQYVQIKPEIANELLNLAATVRNAKSTRLERRTALTEITRLIDVRIAPVLHATGHPTTPILNEVLPSAVYRPSRAYIERVADQANGTYEHGWYDATAVMIRRLVETMIIEVYEFRGSSSKIQDSAGNYLALDDLLNMIVADTSISLSRDTKRALPEIKRLGDRSAHNRRFNATKADLDKVLPGLRVVASDLMHLAGLR